MKIFTGVNTHSHTKSSARTVCNACKRAEITPQGAMMIDT